ncbi:hypothetical protein Dde_0060 [Oleidesulfovibrio alaskensis G20]|jgi:hypothetical protein|uniref:Uncharacterized protein n=1 Tax=Oleidesulfovibrio alaskensis (strain ATCC BAA-1058 / DSM 17464 / G20) TaxID=207559 RepID=Q30UR0_OLEA2|nr:hypothetical protein [Oleidesulfovibrio alaskensis]ABB36861.1 hypothetical protein Dde_0060 [Oleidesulfovibrio alaskensis G20]MBG0774339.1 hypothetical protein [Oleidesulfovibrio alaskensis]MBL3583498.1 hypothetical protein [Oleidesulfovibrio alaskensis]
MSTEFGKALNQIVEVMMFENWLRFYFINEEEDSALLIRVPEQAEEHITKDYAHLAGMLELLNNKEITFESSRNAVCTFVATSLEGRTMRNDLAARVFDSSVFQLEMQLFNIWVQSHEEQLDKSFMEFSTWKSMFEEWKKSDKVKDYVAEMKDTLVRSAKETCTVQ